MHCEVKSARAGLDLTATPPDAIEVQVAGVGIWENGVRWRELLLAVLLIWQGVQLLYIGAIGVPGYFLIPLNDPFAAPPPRADGGIPVAKQEAPAGQVSPQPPPPIESPPDEATKTAAIPSGLPTAGELGGWVKSQAREFVGGVDQAGNILYRFDVWLEPPIDQKQRMVAADYAFDAPSAQPTTESSKNRDTGFRVKFGGLSCARSVAVTVTFINGEKRETEVDGCRILD